MLISLLLSLLANAGTPAWPSSVHVNPSQGTVDSIYNQQHHAEFGSARYALMFTPGYHSNSVEVGYYTSVYGLGSNPSDTTLKSVVCHQAGSTALSTFWRSAENFKTSSMTWAVSQASPIRRIEVGGSLHLSESGYSSGGYMGDMKIDGNVYPGSQQQWFSRNSKFNYWSGGNWNFVWVGCPGAPGDTCGDHMKTRVDETPVIAEKPFISVEGNDWFLNIPEVEENVEGPSWERGTKNTKVPFDKVYIAEPSNINGINSAVSNTQYDAIIFTPGIYHLTQTLEINRSLTLLGLGMATVIPPGLQSAVVVGKGVRDVRIAAILFQANTQNTSNKYDTKATAPMVVVGGYQTVLTDIFARVGGANDQHKIQARADVMLHVTGESVILDNAWFWRADHGVGGLVYDENNPSQNGLVVDGPDFVSYGLKTEHTLKDLSVFNGENAKVYFYQSELPYDVDNWTYAAYKVGANVQTHLGWGLGAYNYFRDHYNDPPDAFSVPRNCGINMKNLLTVHLSGKGLTRNVIGNQGGEAKAGHMYGYVCTYEGNGNCAPTAPPAPVPGPSPIPGPSPVPSPTNPPVQPPSGQKYCVPKPNANPSGVWGAIEWALGSGGISKTGEPSNCHGDRNSKGQYAHQMDGTYVFSKYYALRKSRGGTCDFNGLAYLTSTPEYPGCLYKSTSRLAALEDQNESIGEINETEEHSRKVIRWLDRLLA